MKSLITEVISSIGAGLGAAGGTAVQIARIMKQKMELNKKKKACGSDADCRARIQMQIDNLNKERLKKLAVGAAGGAALGAGGAALKANWSTVAPKVVSVAKDFGTGTIQTAQSMLPMIGLQMGMTKAQQMAMGGENPNMDPDVISAQQDVQKKEEELNRAKEIEDKELEKAKQKLKRDEARR